MLHVFWSVFRQEREKRPYNIVYPIKVGENEKYENYRIFVGRLFVTQMAIRSFLNVLASNLVHMVI